jgi:hypothetical protein
MDDHDEVPVGQLLDDDEEAPVEPSDLDGIATTPEEPTSFPEPLKSPGRAEC